MIGRKEGNPKGTMQDFNSFWDSLQQDKEKVQVVFVLLCKRISRANILPGI